MSYCSLPASLLAQANMFWKRSKLSMPGFFIFSSTRGDTCSGATDSWPPTWCAASSFTYSGERSARS